MLSAALAASQLPKNVTVTTLPSQQSVKDAVANGTLDGGVAVLPSQLACTPCSCPIVDPERPTRRASTWSPRARHRWGRSTPNRWRPGWRACMYASRVPTERRAGRRHAPATVVHRQPDVGHGGKVNLNFFAPNIAVVFLFIGSGLGMRSLLMERSAGTLARITAAPVRPTQIVLGKLLAIFLTGWRPSS